MFLQNLGDFLKTVTELSSNHLLFQGEDRQSPETNCFEVNEPAKAAIAERDPSAPAERPTTGLSPTSSRTWEIWNIFFSGIIIIFRIIELSITRKR